MTFVQENKEKNIRIEKMGIKDISAVVRMCDQCVGEKLYSESEIRDAAVNPHSFIFLLKNQENMLCGYVYFQKTSVFCHRSPQCFGCSNSFPPI